MAYLLRLLSIISLAFGSIIELNDEHMPQTVLGSAASYSVISFYDAEESTPEAAGSR